VILLIASVVLGIVASCIAAPPQGRSSTRTPSRSVRDMADEFQARIGLPKL